jgi:coenzyme F420-0:L-glutamate ligase/coenzyme F420-1:gamma-L-glutamate ligase
MIEIHPLTKIGEIRPGDELGAILAAAIKGLIPRADDILVVTQKIVSKAEGRFVDLTGIRPGADAERLAKITGKDARFVEVVLSESTAVLRAVPNVLITRHRSGHVMANAGIDRSNIGPDSADRVLLLPVDADASAARLQEALRHHFEAPPAIVISDSFGRPWRLGVVNVAIGAVGLPALVDRRGQHDRDGRLLEVTQTALADLAASAAGLATGEGSEGVPAALLRGVPWTGKSAPATVLLRPLDEDLFT